MFKFLRAIDHWFLDSVYQPIADFFNRWIGWSCLRLATLCIDLAIIRTMFTIGVFVSSEKYSNEILSIWLTIFIFFVLGILFLIYIRYKISQDFEKNKSKRNQGGAVYLNPLREKYRTGRFFYLFLFVMTPTYFPLLVATAYYFASCSDGPSGGKLKELWQKLTSRSPEAVLAG